MDETGRVAEPGWRTFLVEHYWPGVTADAFSAAAERVRESAEGLVREGAGVRFLHSTLVPEDEAAFCVLTAESQALVEETYRRARVGFHRVLDAIEAGHGSANEPNCNAGARGLSEPERRVRAVQPRSLVPAHDGRRDS